MAPAASKARRPAAKSPHEASPEAAAAEAFLHARAALESSGDALRKVAEELERSLRSASAAVASAASSCMSLDISRYIFGSKDWALPKTLPILFVLHIIVLLYNAFVFVYMPAAGLTLSSPPSLVFHAVVFLCLASFMRTMETDPGSVPKTPEWTTPERPPVILTECKASSGEPRWCSRANAYKPDRAHNCKELGRCVLRMDHHCVYIGNTVGFHNHKYFILFLLYANVACGMLDIGLLQLLLHIVMPPLAQFLTIGATGLAMLLSSIIMPFLSFHCYLLVNNMTTIEFCEKQGQAAHDEESGTSAEPAGSRYDMGMYQNICSIMGSNPLLWAFPVGGPSGDGLSFPVRDGFARVQTQSASAQRPKVCIRRQQPATTAEAAKQAADAGSAEQQPSPAEADPQQDAISDEEASTGDELGELVSAADMAARHHPEQAASAAPSDSASVWSWASNSAAGFVGSLQLIGSSLGESLCHAKEICTDGGAAVEKRRRSSVLVPAAVEEPRRASLASLSTASSPTPTLLAAAASKSSNRKPYDKKRRSLASAASTCSGDQESLVAFSTSGCEHGSLAGDDVVLVD
eukprot:TRINITY_DN17908_c0_g1_i2.p1 TRINITY_DN17908_c0_g1~~TRINITY_DN17908_c0_g1_i2.p1  ORF type:complete len:578 (-),score=144.05 TRINITY_DN17908_c0_g1_i2:92-1825(-)